MERGDPRCAINKRLGINRRSGLRALSVSLSLSVSVFSSRDGKLRPATGSALISHPEVNFHHSNIPAVLGIMAIVNASAAICLCSVASRELPRMKFTDLTSTPRQFDFSIEASTDSDSPQVRKLTIKFCRCACDADLLGLQAYRLGLLVNRVPSGVRVCCTEAIVGIREALQIH